MKLIKILLILCLPIAVMAQQKTEAGVMIGASNYQGDIASSKIWSPNGIQPAGGFFIRRNISRHFSLRANLLATMLEGDDLNFVDEAAWRADRAFNFSTPLYEISFVPEWHILGNTIKRRNVRPYLFAGIGAAFTTVENNLPVGAIENTDGHYSNNHLAFPMGAGINFDLSNRLALGIELSSRFPITDYLDGVSESGNADKKDWYTFGGFTLGYKFGKPIPKIVDTDGDGVSDDRDSCPLVAGEIQGCPDMDKDGVADIKDECPDLPGDKAFAGCPDTDADGVVDSKDECPDTHGLLALNGCPDSDADGVADNKDKCPGIVGTIASMGCPDDTDGDGIYDVTDECPELAGTINGCPDSDADGISDLYDECPFDAGWRGAKGCPDSDGDGIADKNDKCPNVRGIADNEGCPDVMIAKGEEEKTPTPEKVITEQKNYYVHMIDEIYFNTTRADIEEADYPTLDQVAKVLKDNPHFNLKINGYTDADGDSKINSHLSMRRARRCVKYLVAKGISYSRLAFEGFGEEDPKYDNATEEGKKMNRRVEFAFYQK